jgi:hypothetical protein
MRTFSLFIFVFATATSALSLENGSFSSLYYRYTPGDGIGTGTFVRAFWERQYLLTINGGNYRLEESHCMHSGHRDTNQSYYVEDGYYTEQQSGVFTKSVSFYRQDGSLRRTCQAKDGSAQPSVNEAFSMDCGNNWRWSFEALGMLSGYDYCQPW